MTLMDDILVERTTLARNFRPSWTSLYGWKIYIFSVPVYPFFQ